ncbi:MAG: adenylate/guanylate cyclase with Chase sensor [Chloroflexi bacterium]|nr:adenylate/guanylate cyclase with Chase sensor [Chloroflexota bacterium]
MAAAEGTPSATITTRALLNGTDRHLRCAVTPLHDGDGATRGLILLAEDETARVLAEQAREREEAARRSIRDLFGRFVAESVVEQLVSDPKRAKLGGVRREVTIVFADIRGYTSLSEQNTPEVLVEILGRYLTVAADSIMEHNGTLDKFMGDGVMAIFNAPFDQQDHALAAVRAALLMQRHALDQTDGVTFGVGVNTGEALVGNFGTERFRNYSCVGDAVNVTARLQAYAQGGEVLITDTTLAQVAEHVVVEELGPIDVKGRLTPVQTYRLLAIKD